MILDSRGRPLRRRIGFLREWEAERNDWKHLGDAEPVELVAHSRIHTEPNNDAEQCQTKK